MVIILIYFISEIITWWQPAADRSKSWKSYKNGPSGEKDAPEIIPDPAGVNAAATEYYKTSFKNRVLLFQVKPTKFDPSELLDLLTRFFNILDSLQERSSYYYY